VYNELIMLELAILGLLKEQELHGYELKKRLADRLGFGSGVSFGSLYPALARLESAGAVKAVEAGHSVASAIPLTGSLGGELAAFRARKGTARPGQGSRGKKVYGITERGEALFEELLAAGHQSSGDDRGFNLRLAFARYLPPDARLGMLERRRAQLLDRLVQLRARMKAARERADGYTRSLMEHDHEAAEHDLSWIEQLIATERAGARPDSPDSPESSDNFDPSQPVQSSPTGPSDHIGPAGPSSTGLRPTTSQEDTTS
jgi:DNA-binding PadR family transcriptional regulator